MDAGGDGGVNDETITPQCGRTLVAEVIEQLEALSLAHADGELIGAEDALLARFGVSRPTLRQAAKVAEAECLITVRRGLRGGIYAARPDAAHAIRAPARYLRLQDATLKNMHDVIDLLQPDVLARAAACDDPALIGQLRAFRDDIARRDGEHDSIGAMIETDSALIAIISRMTANPVMVLMMEIAFAFGDLERDLKFYRSPEERVHARRLQRQLCDALLAHDGTRARAIGVLRGALVTRWIDTAEPI